MNPQVQLAWIALITTIVTFAQTIVLEWIRSKKAPQGRQDIADAVHQKIVDSTTTVSKETPPPTA